MIAVALTVGAGSNMVTAAEMAARDVISEIFKSTADRPVDFSDRDLSYLDLANVDFKKALLAGADLYGCDLTRANLSGADLSDTRLDRSTIIGTDFTGANLEGATLLLPAGFSNMAFEQKDAPNFTGVRMAGGRIIARLDGASFRNADLTNVSFGPRGDRSDTISTVLQSKLTGVDFSGGKLEGVNFVNVEMPFSKFVGANLKSVNFTGADLSKANFSGADVTGADFTGATLDGAVFDGAIGLATVRGRTTTQNTDIQVVR